MNGGEWLTACPDWQDRIRSRRSLLPSLPLVESEAKTAVDIFNMMRLPDVPGQPFLEDAAGEWFRDALRALFGSYDPATGIRHISELFVLVPKKNSKTTYSAALMLVAMFVSRRPRAEFLLVAPTQEIADLAFRQAVGIIESDAVLSAKCHIQEHIKRITYRKTGAFLKVKSFDPRVVTGSKPAGVLLDEVHVIAEAHDADRVIGQLRGGLISQPEGFMVQITTQSERQPSGVFLAELKRARAVRDGRLAAPILPMLYEFPPEVDWRDSANWPMVLPNLGRSINLDRLRTEFRGAEESGPEELRRWASQHLNIEIGVALMSDAWIGATYWEQCADPTLTLEEIIRRSDVLEIGIDGGGLDDLLGLAVIGRDAQTGDWLGWTKAWANPELLNLRKAEAGRFRDFAADGDLVLCEYMGQDVQEVAELAHRIYLTGRLDKIGVDPQGIDQIVEALEGCGIDRDVIRTIPQGYRLTSAVKTLERKLADRVFWHDGSRLMNWVVGNAKVEPVASAIRITKQVSGRAKIDPLMALFDAVETLGSAPLVNVMRAEDVPVWI